MSDEDYIDVAEEDEVNAEVESLFVKTQIEPTDEEMFYDMYVPLSVQLENEYWYDLYPVETKEAIETEDPGTVIMPIGLIGCSC